jgi:hypothetical protein
MARAAIGMAAVCLVACAGSAVAAGPDVIVGDLTGVSNYGAGTLNGIAYRAYSIGTTSCNAGTSVLEWIASTNRHPVIAQNIFRWRPVAGAGQFDQVGGSHLKHGFTALQGTVCYNDCQANPDGSALGVHCSDPYGSGLNGSQSGLGPRDEVNAWTGNFRYPFTSRSPSTGVLARRIQVRQTDLDPALNPGAVYFCEGHYVAADDAENNNHFNNMSYRRLTLNTSQFTFSNATGFTTQRQLSALRGWTTVETGVTIQDINVPGEGRFELGYKVTPIAGGMYHYEYAIHNINSDRAGSGFVLNFLSDSFSSCIQPTNVGFNSVGYHSGEPFNNIPWATSKTESGYQWMCTETWAQNLNANALRWGTTYSFRFDSDRPPANGTGTLLLFKPPVGGAPTSVSFNLPVPSGCACQDADYNQDGNVDQDDVQALVDDIAAGTSRNGMDPDYNNDGNRDQNDVVYLIGVVAGGPCQ